MEQALPRDDERRMRLTETERERALRIKEAIEADPDLESFSDFWCVQFALKDHDNVEAALDRARQIQYVREEYGIVEDLEYSMRTLREFQQILPEYVIALEYLERDGDYVLILDYSKLYADTVLRNEATTRVCMSAFFYLAHAVNPEFETIRKGHVALIENAEYDWKRNFGVNFFKRVLSDVIIPYPLNLKLQKHFHTGVFINLLFSMSKHFIPRSIYSKIQMGCQCPGGSIASMYMVPTVRAANQRTLECIRRALEKRYTNEARFSLS